MFKKINRLFKIIFFAAIFLLSGLIFTESSSAAFFSTACVNNRGIEYCSQAAANAFCVYRGYASASSWGQTGGQVSTPCSRCEIWWQGRWVNGNCDGYGFWYCKNVTCVNPPPPPPAPSCSIYFSPAGPLTVLGNSTAIWNSSNAVSATFVCTGPIAGSGALALSGSALFSNMIAGTESCTITVRNSVGASGTCSASVVINPAICTGSIPAFGYSFDAEERSSLTANTAWSYSSVDTSTKCQFRCVPNYTWNGSSCTASCVGSIPAYASAYDAEENTGLTGYITWSYASFDTATKCQYKCNSGYTWNGSSCTAIVYSCTGTAPANATLIPGDNTGLSANTAITLVSANTATKCEYTCNTNYTKSGSTCVFSSRTYTCPAKPANTDWNIVSAYTQTWNGSTWVPASTATTYNTTSDTTSCRYKCAVGYTWNGSTCAAIPAPTCTANFSPAGPLTAPGSSAITLASSNAVSARYTCTGPITATNINTATNGSVPFNNMSAGTENCTFTVTGSTGLTGTCSANITIVNAPINGTCGAAATTYLSTDTAFFPPMCATGSGVTTPASPAFPAIGGTTTWTCGGLYGGSSSGTCTARRNYPLPSCTVSLTKPFPLDIPNSSTLAWSSVNATSFTCNCTGPNPCPTLSPISSGSTVMNFVNPGTEECTLTVTGPGGDVSTCTTQQVNIFRPVDWREI